MWNGSPTRFDLGLFFGKDTVIDDLSNLVEITAQIKDGVNGGVPAENAAVLVSKTISSFDSSLTSATWIDKTKQHAVINLSGAEAKLGVGDKWLILLATLTGVADPVTIAAGKITVKGDGYDSGAGDPPDPAASYLNTEQSDARYPRRGITTADFRPEFTARTGGGASHADSLATAGLAAGYLLEFEVTGEGVKRFRLRAGTAATALPGIFRPTDYAGGTNEKYWEAV